MTQELPAACYCDTCYIENEEQNSSRSHHVILVPTLPCSKVSQTLAENQKYQKMLSLSKKIHVALAASEYGLPEFRLMCSRVELILNYLEAKIPFVLTPISD